MSTWGRKKEKKNSEFSGTPNIGKLPPSLVCFQKDRKRKDKWSHLMHNQNPLFEDLLQKKHDFCIYSKFLFSNVKFVIFEIIQGRWKGRWVHRVYCPQVLLEIHTKSFEISLQHDLNTVVHPKILAFYAASVMYFELQCETWINYTKNGRLTLSNL